MSVSVCLFLSICLSIWLCMSLPCNSQLCQNPCLQPEVLPFISPYTLDCVIQNRGKHCLWSAHKSDSYGCYVFETPEWTTPRRSFTAKQFPTTCQVHPAIRKMVDNIHWSIEENVTIGLQYILLHANEVRVAVSLHGACMHGDMGSFMEGVFRVQTPNA